LHFLIEHKAYGFLKTDNVFNTHFIFATYLFLLKYKVELAELPFLC